MKDISRIKEEFLRIKQLGYTPCTRPNNRDGGIGNTFEDLLGVRENNLSEADFEGFEIKSQRLYNESYITLFSKSPSHPRKANTYLRETFGEIRDPNHPKLKKLYASIFGNRDSIVYGKYKMKLNINREDQNLELNIKDLEDQNLFTVTWTFEHLIKAAGKINNLFLVFADIQNDNNISYHYTKATVYQEFCFNKFLNEIENGNIQFDIRIGVHNSGKQYGKNHDHGSGFRIKKQNFTNLYKSFTIIE